MPNLKTLLRQTLLGTALPGLVAGEGNGSAGGGRTRLWSWQRPRLDHVSGLACDVPDATCGRLRVCERLEWHPLTVRYKQKSFTLRLEPDFLLRRFSATHGEIPTLTHGWLPTTLEAGSLLVFGYELNPGGQLGPMHRKALESDKLMPEPGAPPPPGRPVYVPSGKQLKLPASPLRILVFVEFALCAPRADFEPLGVATMSRIRPHLMLVSNQDLEGFDAALTVMRPETTDMQLAPAHGLHSDQSDGMGRRQSLSLFTDTNQFFLEKPFWSALFDYYKLHVASGSYRMVSPSLAERSIGGAVSVYPSHPYPIPRTVHKVERQGAFDNLHIAPTMIAPLRIRQQAQFRNLPLERITMAPVCVHDCLHLHWRWGRNYEGLAQRGWGRGGPHTAVGTPMIPPNQNLDLEVEESRGFTYRVAVHEKVPRGAPQYFMHHGMAYALALDSKLLGMAVGALARMSFPLSPEASQSWALFYFCLRYADDGLGSPQEALQIHDLTRAMS